MWINTVETALEWTYYLSGPAVAIIAWIGLRQLKLTKEASRLGAKREAIRLAVEECANYGREITPRQISCSRIIVEKKIAIFSKSKIEVVGETIKFVNIPSNEDIAAFFLDKEADNSFLALLNALSSFALPFNTGLADEEVGYSSLRTSYCSTVKVLLPLILILRQRDHQLYGNLLKLFFLWNSRLEAESLKLQQGEIAEKLSALKGKIIRPLGTE